MVRRYKRPLKRSPRKSQRKSKRSQKRRLQSRKYDLYREIRDNEGKAFRSMTALEQLEEVYNSQKKFDYKDFKYVKDEEIVNFKYLTYLNLLWAHPSIPFSNKFSIFMHMDEAPENTFAQFHFQKWSESFHTFTWN